MSHPHKVTEKKKLVRIPCPEDMGSTKYWNNVKKMRVMDPI